MMKKSFWQTGPKVVGTLIKEKDWRKALKAFRCQEIDALELRLDAFSNRDLAKLHQKISCEPALPPLLVTVRSKKEGGVRTLTDNERKGRFRLFAPYASAYDCELSSGNLLAWVRKESGLYKKDLILSYHDFKGVPGKVRLESLLKKSLKFKPALTKFAFKIKSQKDMLALFSFLSQHKKKGLVVIGMAKKGEVSRIVFPLLGSKMTFGHFGSKSAPGQLSAKDLKKKLRRLKP